MTTQTLSFRRALAAADAARIKLERERAARIDAERNRLLLLHMTDRYGYYFAAFSAGIGLGLVIVRAFS